MHADVKASNWDGMIPDSAKQGAQPSGEGHAWTFSTLGKTAAGYAGSTNILVRVDEDLITWQPVDQVSNLPPAR